MGSMEQILNVTADYQRGLPLLQKTIAAARQQDLAAKERQQQGQLEQRGPSL